MFVGSPFLSFQNHLSLKYQGKILEQFILSISCIFVQFLISYYWSIVALQCCISV